MPGAQELLVIALVALLVFGPNRLPELARQAGRLVVRFRSMTQRNLDQLRDVAEIEELERELRDLRAELHRADPRRATDRPRTTPSRTTPSRTTSPRRDTARQDAGDPRPVERDRPASAADERGSHDETRPVTDPEAT